MILSEMISPKFESARSSAIGTHFSLMISFGKLVSDSILFHICRVTPERLLTQDGSIFTASFSESPVIDRIHRVYENGFVGIQSRLL
jgi:hypothetical protein